MSQLKSFFFTSLCCFYCDNISRMATCYQYVEFRTCDCKTSYSLCLDSHVYFGLLGIPKFQTTIIRHGYKFLFTQFKHLVDAWRMFLNTFNWLYLNPLICMTYALFFLLYFIVSFSNEMKWFFVQPRNSVINDIFCCKVWQNLHLAINVSFLMFS